MSINHETIQYYNFKMENMSNCYEIIELSEGSFITTFNIINQYQWKDPCMTEKLKCENYQTGYFCWHMNTIQIIMHKDKMVIPQKL